MKDTLTALLDLRAQEAPDRVAFQFLRYGQGPDEQVTFGELRDDAHRIGQQLAHRFAAGERVLLVYDSGIDFIRAMFACFYARLVAMPSSPPRKPYERSLTRLAAMADDGQPVAVLAPSRLRDVLLPHAEAVTRLAGLSWLDPTDLLGSPPEAPPIGDSVPVLAADSTAYLQYTSGSTSTPRGVVITHGNVIENCADAYRRWHYGEESVIVSWLPVFHDMGLILGIMQPIFTGCRSVLMTPESFIQRPLRWLQAMSEHRATHSIAPNFAYELCVRKVSEQDRKPLDLSALRVCANGSEPVRWSTVQRFAQVFGDCGFDAAAHCPAYGLAEATLVVSATPPGALPRVLHLDAAEYGLGRVRGHLDASSDTVPVVSCGPPLDGVDIQIVDPDTGARRAPNEVGEIWVAGPLVSPGYRGQPEATARTFGVRSEGRGPYLRTGDLGFRHDGEIYVSGRIKDLIIVRGRNVYPQDLELTAEAAHPGLRPGCGAAFTADDSDEPSVVLVQEVSRDFPADRVQAAGQAIMSAVAVEHEVALAGVVLVGPGTIAKTSSGKIQRQRCRQQFHAGSLTERGRWFPGRTPDDPADDTDTAGPVDQTVVRQRLRELVAGQLGMAPSGIDDRTPLQSYGLDSRRAVELSAQIGDWTGIPVADTLVYDFPTVAELAAHVTSSVPAARLREVEAGSGDLTAGGPGATAGAPTGDAEGIAVVGIGCRLPGADGVDALWDLLRQGEDAVGTVPPDRWRDPTGADWDPRLRAGGYLAGLGPFDAGFFGVSDREARSMDPQQRLVMEVAWEAIEDAGIVPRSLADSSTGVFIGVATSDHSTLTGDSDEQDSSYAVTGSAHSIVANRVSYFLNLRGPSVAVDSACSSSLLAVHLAADAIRRGDCETALVGGVNAILSPELSHRLARAQLLSPGGRCRSFDAEADGYVRGEGVGVVVLKPLRRAVADGDRVYGVIRATTTNHDGRTNGLTAPSRASQEDLLRSCLQRAGLRGSDVDFVEAHGSGTALGDAMEAQALGAVYGSAAGRDTAQPCLIGSVKSNIGHLEAAAGIAGLIKACLALWHREVPPSVHHRVPNRHVDLPALGLRVPTVVTPLDTGGRPPRAAVSSFGFGGTNAHAIVEAYDGPARRPATGGARTAHVLPLSARSLDSLRRLADGYLDHVRGDPELVPAEFCAAASRRETHRYRLAVGFTDRADLPGALADARERRPEPVDQIPQPPVFVYGGQGTHLGDLGRRLLDEEPVYRDTFARCDAVVRAEADCSLLDLVREGASPEQVGQSWLAQPLLVAQQLALTELWSSWGVSPVATIGHSLGEVAAACVGGHLTLEAAVTLAVRRAAVLRPARGTGGMLAVRLGEDDLRDRLRPFGDRVWIAAINAPTRTVAAGDEEILAEVEAALARDAVSTRRLSVAYPFHGPSMDRYRDELEAACDDLAVRRRPAGTVVSTLTGEVAGPDAFTAAHWGRHLTGPVRFAVGVATLISAGHRTFVEIGPDAVLSGPLAEGLAAAGAQGWVTATARRDAGDAVPLGALAGLYERGHDIDWTRVNPGGHGLRLPTYPWDRSDLPAVPRRRRDPVEPAEGRGEGAAPSAGTVPAPTGPLAGTDPDRSVLGWVSARVDVEQPAPRKGRWLVLQDRGGVGERLAVRLREHGIAVQVAPAPWPDELPRMRAALQESLTGVDTPATILYLGALDVEAAATASAALSDLRVGCSAVVALAQELTAGSGAPPALCCVTVQAQNVTGVELVRPSGTALWAAVRSLSHEVPDAASGLLDLERLDDDELDAVAALLAGGGMGRQLARRGGEWFEPRLTTVSGPVPPARLDPDATYVVTGGLGALGGTVARWLVARGARKLALISRGASAEAARERLAELAGSGVRVATFRADVGDGVALTAAVEKATAAMGRLGGVVHAAGVLRDATLPNLDERKLTEVLAPKVVGALHLCRLARAAGADFVLLFSSVAGTVGSAGQTNYAAANGYLDGLAHNRRRQGEPVVSVAWGPWADQGMAARALAGGQASVRLRAFTPMHPQEAMGVLDAALAGRHPHLLPVTVDGRRFATAFPAAARLLGDGMVPRPGPAVDRSTGSAVAEPAPADVVPAAVDTAQIPVEVRNALAQALGCEPQAVEPGRPFMDLGLDSLTAIDLRADLQARLGVTFPVTVIWNYPTVRQLAAHLATLPVAAVPDPEPPTGQVAPPQAGPGAAVARPDLPVPVVAGGPPADDERRTTADSGALGSAIVDLLTAVESMSDDEITQLSPRS